MCGIIGYVGSRHAKDILISGLERLESFSQEGAAIVWAQFAMEKGSVASVNEVRDQIARLGDQLPRVTRAPRIEAFNANAAPIVLVAVRADREQWLAVPASPVPVLQAAARERPRQDEAVGAGPEAQTRTRG